MFRAGEQCGQTVGTVRIPLAAPRYLLRDRDGIYGNEVRRRIASLCIEEVLTAPRSPWQNPYAERLIGSIRRDCLNHFVILNTRHLRRTLASYFAYYHGSRTHLGFDKQLWLVKARRGMVS
jgi:putative transposase